MDKHPCLTLPTYYQQFVHLSRYARWIPDLGRREKWPETVMRYLDYMCDFQCKDKVPAEIKVELARAITCLEVMPSMRCMMTAGDALRTSNIAGYNCAYVAVDHPSAFDEALLILMNGTGIGFSIERQFICNLPNVAERLRPSNSIIVVEDSKFGWADGLRELISSLYAGIIPKWDLSKVRPAGARLKTFGGRASGPGPLDELFRFCVDMFKEAAGRKLTSIECHDLMCKIGEVVVVGGVRRSAMISLSNPSDDRMRHAKSGEWWKTHPHRALANNSACWVDKPDSGTFMREWLALYESKSGERGIFNRPAAKKQVERFERRKPEFEWGTNPCSEIILRSSQFCNLSEVIVRAHDTEETLRKKIRLAVILGTMQATLVDFPYLRKIWRQNTEEEALLGVSLTGIMDNAMMSGADGKKKLAEVLGRLREYAVSVNKEWAAKLGINPATAITCIKPSGTVSQLVDCASGIHPRFAPFYIRTIRADKKDPLAQMMVEMGFPHEDDITKPMHNWVFSFPMEAPKTAQFGNDVSAVDMLDLWKTYQDHWTEHKPSITVYIKESEWLEAGAWVFKHFDSVSGIAFLPSTGHSYRQAPYQEVTEDEYKAAMAKMPQNVVWDALSGFEKEDTSNGHRELSCTGNKCELADIESEHKASA